MYDVSPALMLRPGEGRVEGEGSIRVGVGQSLGEERSRGQVIEQWYWGAPNTGAVKARAGWGRGCGRYGSYGTT